jgi:hypothetical protein
LISSPEEFTAAQKVLEEQETDEKGMSVGSIDCGGAHAVPSNVTA